MKKIKLCRGLDPGHLLQNPRFYSWATKAEQRSLVAAQKNRGVPSEPVDGAECIPEAAGLFQFRNSISHWQIGTAPKQAGTALDNGTLCPALETHTFVSGVSIFLGLASGLVNLVTWMGACGHPIVNIPVHFDPCGHAKGLFCTTHVSKFTFSYNAKAENGFMSDKV